MKQWINVARRRGLSIILDCYLKFFRRFFGSRVLIDNEFGGILRVWIS